MENRISTNRIWLELILISIIGSNILSLAGMRDSFHISLIMNGIRLAYVALLFRRGASDLRTYCSIKKPSPVWGMVFIIPVTILAFIAAQYISSLSMIFFTNHVNGRIAGMDPRIVSMIISSAVFPALVEEIYFRGVFLRGVGGKWKGILVTAFMFALYHMNFNQMAYSFAMGILFAAILIAADSLIIPMLIHLLFNMITIGMHCYPGHPMMAFLIRAHIGPYYLFTDHFRDSSGHIITEALAVGAGVAVAAIAVLYVLIRIWGNISEKKEKEPVFQEKWKPDLSFWLACGICILAALLMEFN